MANSFKKIGVYLNSGSKRVLDIICSCSVLILGFPILILIYFTIYVTTASPCFFVQKRVGKSGKIFKIIKFRTMVVGAEHKQKLYQKLNEADGPVFKIYNDPRFTKIGKVLSRSGLDELPQFFNILKGEMSIVGPRPLPVNEANRLSNVQKIRELVKPGIVSTWVTHGSHNLKFIDWMKLDREYVENGTLITDLTVIKDSAIMIFKNIFKVLS